jgi:hypothetical protein
MLRQLVDKIADELRHPSMRHLQEYLLGGLTARQRSRIDRRVVSDENFFQELVAAEDALVHDYVRGLLPSDVAARLEAILGLSPEWARKVEFGRATRVLLGRRAKQSGNVGGATLADAVYEELVAVAKLPKLHLATERKLTLGPADLVDEVYQRLGMNASVSTVDRPQFLAMADS